jgi:purine nucleoside phosphorylase
MIISAGLAGALDPQILVGKVLRPTQVIDAATDEKYVTLRDGSASGVLVTAASVLTRDEKEAMRRKFNADVVDMEAAVVGEIARAARVPFVAVKAISDPLDLVMPPIDQFIDSNGRLHLLKLLGYAALRPRTWKSLNELRRNSESAAEDLAAELSKIVSV